MSLVPVFFTSVACCPVVSLIAILNALTIVESLFPRNAGHLFPKEADTTSSPCVFSCTPLQTFMIFCSTASSVRLGGIRASTSNWAEEGIVLVSSPAVIFVTEPVNAFNFEASSFVTHEDSSFFQRLMASSQLSLQLHPPAACPPPAAPASLPRHCPLHPLAPLPPPPPP